MIQNVKGTSDSFGREQLLRKQIQMVLEEIFTACDFDPMETSILNEMKLLASKYGGGDEILKEVYQLRDQGSRELGLRYDLTLPFAKVLALHPGLPLPFRRYEIGKVFRDGPVKKGRRREFIQCDADIAGVDGLEAETELMLMAAIVFSRLELPIVFRWNNRRFLGELLEAMGIKAEARLSVMLTLDKLDKIGVSGVRQELAAKELETKSAEAVLTLLQQQNITFQEICAVFQLENTAGAAEVRTLQALIGQAGLQSVCRYDPFLSRGLSFYTGTVFEIFDATGQYRSSLAAGGRYDSIIGRLSDSVEGQIPAVGISFGIESILSLLEQQARPAGAAIPAVTVIPVGGNMPQAVEATALLRQNGIRARLEYSGRKVGKSLASASKSGCRYVILIGEDEVRRGTVTLRDMQEQSESSMPLEAAVMVIEKNTDTRLFY